MVVRPFAAQCIGERAVPPWGRSGAPAAGSSSRPVPIQEFSRDGRGMLGNFPQQLTHLSQVTARLAIDALAVWQGL